MRGEVEAKISDQAQQVNGLLDGIENTTNRLNQTFDSATRAGLLDERAFDLGSALVAFVIERPRHGGAGLPIAQSCKLIAVSGQDLVAGIDDELHDEE